MKRTDVDEDNRENFDVPGDQRAFNPVVSSGITGPEYWKPRKEPAPIAFSGAGTAILLDRDGKATGSTGYCLT